MNKIFTFGDGYATGHIWPEWPQILQALLPEYQIVNTAAIGAGAEFLVSSLIDILPTMHQQQAIIQWPQADRFDKLLQDQSWHTTISNDSVYHFNRVHDSQKREWWLSSASANDTTQDQESYSKQTKFITNRQNQIQPSPIVHFYWIVEKILPNLSVQIDQLRLEMLEDSINKTNWIPYDPNRKSIWQGIVKPQRL